MNSKLILIAFAALLLVVSSAPAPESEESKVSTESKESKESSSSSEEDKDSEEDDKENRLTTQATTEDKPSTPAAAATPFAQLLPFGNLAQSNSLLGSLFTKQDADTHLSSITSGVLSSLTNLTESTVEVLNTAVNETTVGEILDVSPPEPTVTLADISGADQETESPKEEVTTVSSKDTDVKVTTVSAKDLEAEEEAEKIAEVNAVPVIFTQGV